MLGMLDDYVDHIQATGNQSLLARIYGVFTFKTNYFAPIDVIIMQNTCDLQNKTNQKMVFDLKGSTVGRKTKFPKDQEKFWHQTFN